MTVEELLTKLGEAGVAMDDLAAGLPANHPLRLYVAPIQDNLSRLSHLIAVANDTYIIQLPEA